MYCVGVLTFDGGFMDSSSSRTKCTTERLKTSQRQGCVREKASRNGRGRRRVAEKRAPILRRAIRGDQRRARFMSPHEDLEQIFSCARAEFLHGEILEDQQVDVCQLLDEVATSAGRFGLGEIRREVKRTPRGRPRSLSHARLRPHHLALPKEGVLKRTLGTDEIASRSQPSRSVNPRTQTEVCAS